MATIKFENSVELERLLSTDKEMKAAMDRIIAAVLSKALKDTRASIQIKNDPLRARQAVHMAIYKKCFGGNLNLYSRKRREGDAPVPASRRGRTSETERLMRLQGYDRTFILNILNSGTPERVAKKMNGRDMKRESVYQRRGNRVFKSMTLGYRGIIPGQAFFGTAAGNAIERNVEIFQEQIEAEILKIINRK